MILLLTLYLAFSMLLLAETSLPLKQLVQEARARTTSGDRGEGYDKGFFPNLKRYQAVLLQNIPLQPSSSMQTFNIYQKIYRLVLLWWSYAANMKLYKNPLVGHFSSSRPPPHAVASPSAC